MADKKAKKLRLFKALLLLILVVCLYVKVTYFAGLISFQTRDATSNPVYHAYGENLWYDTQCFKVWLTVDTDAQTVTVQWEGHAAIALPLPSVFGFVSVKVWTDNGRSLTLGDQPDGNAFKKYYRTVVFERACMRLALVDTWCYARVWWNYAGADWLITVPCKTSVYVET